MGCDGVMARHNLCSYGRDFLGVNFCGPHFDRASQFHVLLIDRQSSGKLENDQAKILASRHPMPHLQQEWNQTREFLTIIPFLSVFSFVIFRTVPKDNAVFSK